MNTTAATEGAGPVARTEDRSAARIHHRIVGRVEEFAAAGPEAIDRRLKELEEEWDIERVIATGSAATVLAGVGLGMIDRRLLALPAAAGGLLLLHTLGVRSPLAVALRSLGLRTAVEIGEERTALKVLRGDFHDLSRLTSAEDRADRARWEDEGGTATGTEAENAHDRSVAADAVEAAKR